MGQDLRVISGQSLPDKRQNSDRIVFQIRIIATSDFG